LTLFQKLIKNNYQKLNFFLICSVIISFPFNEEIILFFRMNDLFAISLIVINLNLLTKKNWLYILNIFLIFTFSNILGIFYSKNFFFIKVIFYYKIFIIIFFFFFL